MKRIYYLLTLLLLAVSPALLTSCDDDPWYDDYYGDWYDDYDWYDKPFNKGDNTLVQMAQMINGIWTGTLTNEYTDDNGNRQRTNMYVDFQFTQYSNTSCNGRGTETDYAPSYDENGSPLLDANGKQVYDTQTLGFKWYVDPRTYNIYIEYDSGYRFVLDSQGNSDYSGFSLDNSNFNGVMEGVNNDEYVFFDCQRVTSSNAPSKLMAFTGNVASIENKLPDSAKHISFGIAKSLKRVNDNLPFALRRR